MEVLTRIKPPARGPEGRGQNPQQKGGESSFKADPPLSSRLAGSVLVVGKNSSLQKRGKRRRE